MKKTRFFEKAIKYFSEFNMLFIQFISIAGFFYLVCYGLMIRFSVPNKIILIIYMALVLVSYYYLNYIYHKELLLKDTGKAVFTLVSAVIFIFIAPVIEFGGFGTDYLFFNETTVSNISFNEISMITFAFYTALFVTYIMAYVIEITFDKATTMISPRVSKIIKKFKKNT